MNDLTISFRLRQQTPHLHFLHRQRGPTLRLTELKAKLDRLIARHCFGDNFSNARSFLVGYRPEKPDALQSKWKDEHFRAFDYRIRLQFPASGREEMWAVSTPSAKFAKVIKNETNDEWLGETPYFADNDKTELQNEDLKKGVHFSQPIGLEVFSWHEELIRHVKEYLPVLFAIENFGCRQSKGFGGYWLEGASFEEALKKAREKDEITGAWAFGKRHFAADDLSNIFKQIAKDYRVLKSGFNHPMDEHQYQKSLLFKYFADDNIRWEKRKIKQEIHKKQSGALKYTRAAIDLDGGRERNDWNDPPGAAYDYRYIRALLGLAEQYEFQSNSGEKIKVKISHPEIERFRSPITVKVVNGKIYWLAVAKQTDKMLGKTFEFSAEQGSTVFFRNQPITTPVKFDLAGFLDAAILPLGYQKLSL